MAYGLPTWLGGSSSPSSQAPANSPPKSEDGGYIAPDRSKREVCYESRDLFFDCLDRNKILDAVKSDADAKEKCGKELQEFEGACVKSWVSHAIRMRDGNGFSNRTMANCCAYRSNISKKSE